MLTLFVAACSGGGGDTANSNPADVGLLATARLGPSGGTLLVTSGAHAGVRLTVPPGVVGTATDFSVWIDTEQDALPSLFPVYRFEPADIDLGGRQVAVTIRAGAAFFGGNETGPTLLAVFARPPAATRFGLLPQSALNEIDRTVMAATDHLGRFVALDGDLHRLFTQEVTVLDPAVDTDTATLFGVAITSENGPERLRVGRGSLASFWSSPANANVLILHGLGGSPLDFLGSGDLVANLDPAVANIVLAMYPSARGVAANANALYDLIQQNRQPGFGCTIIAHSMGGLVARYMIEKSADDADRPGRADGDPPLSSFVTKLFLVGTPNAGSATAGEIFAGLLPVLPAADARFMQAGLDLAEGPGSFTAQLNSGYVDNTTVYHDIYGNLGNGSDGIVSVASARALPAPPESEREFFAAHGGLHLDAAPLGVAGWINLLLQMP
ncbi:MAG TPA: hypothetical protein VFZ65_08055 [Planctomycetota bacterium]|nr:hypothetical protein [Planctomycetota bacterium]